MHCCFNLRLFVFGDAIGKLTDVREPPQPRPEKVCEDDGHDDANEDDDDDDDDNDDDEDEHNDNEDEIMAKRHERHFFIPRMKHRYLLGN